LTFDFVISPTTNAAYFVVDNLFGSRLSSSFFLGGNKHFQYNQIMLSIKHYYCTIFKTKWGYFGLCCTENGVFRTCLPVKSKAACQKLLTQGLEGTIFKKTSSCPLKKAITSYYKGTYKSFNCAFDMTGFTPFACKVLQACMKVTYGQTITYKQLAGLAGHPNAARAVGAVMARNRTPLLIPCHRVLASDGTLHGFSAPGGLKTKQKMLILEKAIERRLLP
jgi:methylated-DNA-[protein]-cysteine S-methyltransferase